MTEEIPLWAKNLTNPEYSKSISIVSTNTLPSPPGFKSSNGSTNKTGKAEASFKSQQNVNGLLVQKAWQIALQPAKAIPMNMFMSYMSGSSLQIISIMTALMLISNPVKGVANIRRTFKPVLGNSETQSQVLVAMVMFVVFQAALMGIGVHKLNSMGLIPNTKSDWLFMEKPVNYEEKSYAF